MRKRNGLGWGDAEGRCFYRSKLRKRRQTRQAFQKPGQPCLAENSGPDARTVLDGQTPALSGRPATLVRGGGEGHRPREPAGRVWGLSGGLRLVPGGMRGATWCF